MWHSIKSDWKFLKKNLVQENKLISTDDIVKMAIFVFENNYFQLNLEVKQQISGTTYGNKFSSIYACAFMNQVETDFLRVQENVPLF